ncbi:AraC family transcriptional regulator [Bermanella sp. R86510]|uniref:AraC family transcriptional regulator n=1 Tax=unclassified Bermanella TaxID=2627862 RepID=UPI0037CA5312
MRQIVQKILSKWMKQTAMVLLCLPLMAVANDAQIDFAAEARAKSAQQALDTVKNLSKDIQTLKASVVDLNKDLRLMEEELLFPSSTRATVFVSLDVGHFFTLEGIKLKLDGKQVASHIYSEKQRSALSRGGVQRLHVTNLNRGMHNLSAFFTGKGPNGRPYKRAAELTFTKGQGSQYIELAIIDDTAKQEPIFEIKQW